MKLASLLILILLIHGCAQPTHGPLLKRNSKNFYQSSGVIKYFLSELPDWANTSEESSCQRSYSVKYFNFNNLAASYQLTYKDNIQLQYLFNQNNRESRKKYSIENLPLKQEEALFYDSFDKVKAKFLPFRAPTFQRINVVWVDHYLKDKKGTDLLVSLMKSKAMTLGHPVWVSNCFGRRELEESIRSMGLDTFNIRVLPIEAFSPYNTDNVLTTEVGLSLRNLFSTGQKIFLYLKSGLDRPTEITSYDQLIYY